MKKCECASCLNTDPTLLLHSKDCINSRIFYINTNMESEKDISYFVQRLRSELLIETNIN